MRDFLPSYDNIYLRPCLSSLSHRADADTSVDFLGRKFKLPVVPANMEDVISFDNAMYLASNGYFYIMHRFKDAPFQFVGYAVQKNFPYISISIGVGEAAQDDLERIIVTYGEVIDFLTVDVAHAHHQNVDDMMNFIRDLYDGRLKKPKIIAGNVATAEGYRFLCECGVDAVKIGIGGGSICTTRFETGFHIPTAASILDVVNEPEQWKKPIIADGGIKHHGDIAKAIALGADMVMAGGLFASCFDSPAKVEHGKKIYRGSTSYEAKGNGNHVEGKTLELEGDITYVKRMEKIKQALCSSISYAGGTDLKSLKRVNWHIVL